MKSAWDRAGLAVEIDAYWAHPTEVAFRQAVAGDLRGKLQPGDVLEVGCGTGRIYAALQAAGLLQGHGYCGGDSSAAMLDLARAQHPEAAWLDLDVLALRHQAANVLCIQVLQHLAASRKLLYVVTWFGAGDRQQDPATGIWQNWLDAAEFQAACAAWGSVSWRELAPTCSAVTVLKEAALE